MSEVEIRAASFRERHLTWAVVHHFLPADLLAEYCAALVDAVSGGALELGDLMNASKPAGDPALTTWAIQLKPGKAALGEFLQRFIQSVVWQGDAEPFSRPDAEIEESARIVIRNLSAALDLACSDLSTIAVVDSRADRGLQDLAAVISELAATDEEDVEVLASLVEKATADLEPPLSSIVVKHLGDLCAAADRWRQSARLYRDAERKLTQVGNFGIDAAWRNLHSNLKVIVGQSRAAATWALDGPKRADPELRAVLSRSSFDADPLAAINAGHDSVVAAFESGPADDPPAERGAIVSAPLTIGTLKLGNALSAWRNADYRNADRWFWAVLRREIALGSTSISASTRALFGECILDRLQFKLRDERRPASFWLGVRLLLESRSARAASALDWQTPFLEAYLTLDLVQAVAAHVGRAEGVRAERAVVAAALFGAWSERLPAHAETLVRAMMVFLAETARDYDWSFLGNRNAAGDALKALQRIANARPEFARLAPREVAEAILKTMGKRRFGEVAQALETASAYANYFDTQTLEELAYDTVSALGPLDRAVPIAADALAFLCSEALLTRARQNAVFGEHIVQTILDLSLALETEHPRLLFRLRNLDPGLVRGRLNDERLREAVNGVRQRARQLNSSGASNCIAALLAASAISGAEGVADAIAGLRELLQTAYRRPSIALWNAYYPILLLARDRQNLSEGLGVPPEAVDEMIAPLLGDIEALWDAASRNPLLFAAFSIPASTAPQRTVVFNWAYASMALARVLDATQAMQASLQRAAALAPVLAEPIATAIVMRDDDARDPPNADVIAQETYPTFYAALGQRLSLFGTLDAKLRVGLLTALVSQAFKLGPNGLDAGIYTAMLAQGIRIARTPDAKAYEMRLANQPELRRSLGPLFAALFAHPE